MSKERKKEVKMVIGSSLALLALALFGFVIVRLMFVDVPFSNSDYFNTALIALVGFVGTGFGFFLGSSFGSARKTELEKVEGGGSEGSEPKPEESEVKE